MNDTAADTWRRRLDEARRLRALKDEEGFVREALAAFRARPDHAEALYELARFYRERGKHDLSVVYCEAGLALARPRVNAPPREVEDRQIGFIQEYAIAANYASDPARKDRGFAACNWLALNRKVAAETRDLAVSNLRFYVGPAGQMMPSFATRPVSFVPPDDYRPMNASIVRKDDQIMLALRTVNYTLDKSRPEGDIRRLSVPGGEPVATRNYLLSLTSDFEVHSSSEISSPSEFPGSDSHPEVGFEDIRLFDWRGALWCCASSRDLTPDRWFQQVLARIDQVAPGVHRLDDWRVLQPEGPQEHEKNWMPLVAGENLRFIRLCDPTCVLDERAQTVTEATPAIWADHFRGGSQLVDFDGGWLALIHETRVRNHQRFYRHRFVWFDAETRLQAVSRPFYFQTNGIEFAAGLAWRADRQGLMISYGVEDSQSWIATVDADDVRRVIDRVDQLPWGDPGEAGQAALRQVEALAAASESSPADFHNLDFDRTLSAIEPCDHLVSPSTNNRRILSDASDPPRTLIDGYDRVGYWLKGEPIQNFGDFIAELLLERLFTGEPIEARRIYIIGSVISDHYVSNEVASSQFAEGLNDGPVAFWGCGLRDEHSLSPSLRQTAQFLAVRGPLTRTALNLPDTIPLGDPGFLLPALHTANRSQSTHGKTICIPHFHDRRSDEEFLSISGCEILIRPNIANSIDSILDLVDAIASASFVLSASLHGAIVAAAYGRPFGFWDNGYIDCPFKWRDFAASANFECQFFRSYDSAADYYERQIVPVFRYPVLSALISSAPFALNPAVSKNIMAIDADHLARGVSWSGHTQAIPANSKPTTDGKTIGLCMIVKNESRVILRCLESVRPLIDYVLVEDTGSTDGTQEIIRDWLQRVGLPGQVIDEPWRDFAYNRTHVLAKLRENPEIDYALIIDADDRLVPDPGFDANALRATLTKDLYEVELRNGGVHYRRGQLCSNRLEFRYRGVLHEFLDGPPNCEISSAALSGFHIISGREGARSQDPDKYKKDARILANALRREKDPFLKSRYTYYLARSYRDAGEDDKALTHYIARSKLGFWKDEIFDSLYCAAEILKSRNRPIDEVLATYLRASEAAPTRAEALHAASRLCRDNGRFAEGFDYARRGLAIPFPPDGLFVQAWVYDYGLLDELAVNAYWAEKYAECVVACDRLLKDGKLPADQRDRVQANRSFALSKLGESQAEPSAAQGFEASLNAARMKEELACPDDEVLAAYSETIAADPTRAEAHHAAARYCRIRGLYSRGYEFASAGLTIDRPTAGAAIEPWIYDYGLLDELAVNAYWIGKYDECVAACDRLLTEGKMPHDMRDRVSKNHDFAIEKLSQASTVTSAVAMPAVGKSRTIPGMVSVITPTRNRSAFLNRATRYFQDQTYKNIEWHILDDSDHPSDTLSNLASDNVFYTHSNQSLSIGEKRNILIDNSRGEFIAHFDDDDYYSSTYITSMIDSMSETDADLINLRSWFLYDARSDFFGYWDLMKKSGLHFRCGSRGVSRVDFTDDNNENLKLSHLGYGFSFLFKRKVWDRVKFPSINWNEDTEFSVEAGNHFNIRGVKDTTGRCLHILHSNSTSSCLPQYNLPTSLIPTIFPGLELPLPVDESVDREASAPA